MATKSVPQHKRLAMGEKVGFSKGGAVKPPMKPSTGKMAPPFGKKGKGADCK